MRRCERCPVPGDLRCPAIHAARFCDLLASGRDDYRPVIMAMAQGMPAEPPPPVFTPRPAPVSRIVIRTYLYALNGYGQIAEHLGRGLEALGIPVAYWPISITEDDAPIPDWQRARIVQDSVTEWVLQLATPGTMPPPGYRSCQASMWESDGLLPGVTKALNMAEVVIVPCEFNRESFACAGVTRPIHVVPMGVSAEEGYHRTDDPPTDPFVFACAGRMAHGGKRKALGEVVEAFSAAFPIEQDVRLRVKAWPECPLGKPADPRVTIDRRPLQPPGMADWLRGVSCYVTVAKGEGWGLMTHQAMAVGRPVIVIPWSGTADFWTPDCGWPVDFRLEPAGEFYVGSGNWAVADMGSLVRAMRYAYEHREEVVVKGRAAAKRAAEFTWTRTARELRKVLVSAGMLEPKKRVPLGEPHCLPCVSSQRASVF